MGGYMFATGLLTLYVAITSFRTRVRGVAGVALLAGLTSIGWMAVVNFTALMRLADHWAADIWSAHDEC